MDVISVVRLQTKAIGKTAAGGDNVFSESAIVFRNGPSQSYTWQSNTQSTAGDSSVSAGNAGMAARKLRSGMLVVKAECQCVWPCLGQVQLTALDDTVTLLQALDIQVKVITNALSTGTNQFY
jgi:hypothetical protein